MSTQQPRPGDRVEYHMPGAKLRNTWRPAVVVEAYPGSDDAPLTATVAVFTLAEDGTMPVHRASRIKEGVRGGEWRWPEKDESDALPKKKTKTAPVIAQAPPVLPLVIEECVMPDVVTDDALDDCYSSVQPAD